MCSSRFTPARSTIRLLVESGVAPNRIPTLLASAIVADLESYLTGQKTLDLDDIRAHNQYLIQSLTNEARLTVTALAN